MIAAVSPVKLSSEQSLNILIYANLVKGQKVDMDPQPLIVDNNEGEGIAEFTNTQNYKRKIWKQVSNALLLGKMMMKAMNIV
jgi:hypothetical protein